MRVALGSTIMEEEMDTDEVRCTRHGIFSGMTHCPKCEQEEETCEDTSEDHKKYTRVHGMLFGVEDGNTVDWSTPLRDGKQSLRPYRMDLVDAKALLKLANVMHEGTRTHDPESWRELEIHDHLNHAMTHILAYRAGNRDLDHLSRAFTRLMMAVAIQEDQNEV